jgi:sulfite exporter TauE/SafE
MDIRRIMAIAAPAGRSVPSQARRWLPSIFRIMVTTVALVGSARAQNLAPIYLIEPFLKTGVLVHFDTVAFKRYDLQSTTNLLGSINGTVPWTTIYTVPPVPFENHYIVLDPITNAPAKCYRILVSP